MAKKAAKKTKSVSAKKASSKTVRKPRPKPVKTESFEAHEKEFEENIKQLISKREMPEEVYERNVLETDFKTFVGVVIILILLFVLIVIIRTMYYPSPVLVG